MVERLLLTIIIIFTCFILNAQKENSFWVMVEDVTAKEGDDCKSFTNSDNVNELFKRYNVIEYKQALPFAKTPRLHDVYEIKCNCDIDKLIYELEKYPKFFSAFKKNESVQVELYDPIDWQWVAHAEDWLWHLKIIEADKAWDITRGNPNVKTAVIDTDFDVDHPDLATKIFPHYDPYSLYQYSCDVSYVERHGTYVASFIAGETTEVGGDPKGQLASVGFNTMMMAYTVPNTNHLYLQKALHASSYMKADILTSSAGGWYECPDETGIHQLIVKEILDNGTTIIMPAGNGETGDHNKCDSIDPDNHIPFFPLTPYYDERVIMVSSTGRDDKHLYINSSGEDRTHSHYSTVDFCAPGYEVMGAKLTKCGDEDWPYFGQCVGTSFSAPIVAGVASLMYSVNPCLTPLLCKDILKNTTDPIIDAADYPGGVGTGRVNAYKAVKAALETYSPKLDLYIKDRPEDIGISGGYAWDADRDNSPDIWIRNQADGLQNREHETPEYDPLKPVHVYVRVRNKSCVKSKGDEKLSLYWSKASGWSSWPHNWDGSEPEIGNRIGSINIGEIEPGRDSTYRFTWRISIWDNPGEEGWAQCLLARIEGSADDPTISYPGELNSDVYLNNNIAWKNLVVMDMKNNYEAWDPCGRYVFIGNPTDKAANMTISFDESVEIGLSGLTEEAEINLIFEEKCWKILRDVLVKNKDIEIVREGEIRLRSKNVELNNIYFPAKSRFPVFIKYKYITSQLTSKESFGYHMREYLSGKVPEKLGGVHFKIEKPDGLKFRANAGKDHILKNGENVILESELQKGNFIYKWFDSNNNLLHTGERYEITPIHSEIITLEVESEDLCALDRSKIELIVRPNYIESISPNPAETEIVVSYELEDAKKCYLRISNQLGVSSIYEVDIFKREKVINIKDYTSGIYTITLFCDNVEYNSKNFVKQ